MSVRVRGDRYYVEVKCRLPDGRHVRLSDLLSPVQTRKGAEQYEREIRQRLLDGTYGKQSMKLEDFWPTLHTWNGNNTKPAHAKAVEVAFRLHILPRLGHKRLDEVTASEIEGLKAKLLAEKYAPKTVNNILGYLHRALTLAIQHGKLDSAPGVGLLELDESEAEWLEVAEQTRFLEAAAYWPDRAPLLTVLLDTGLRIGEALALRPRDIDLERRVLFVRRTRVAITGEFGRPKEGKPREVHLTDRAVTTLKSIRGLRELVFTTEKGEPLTHAMVRDWVADAAKRAGLAKHVTSHSLRHSRTALLSMAGVDERTIMDQLGWTTPNMVRRYAHLSHAHRRDAVTKVEEFLISAAPKQGAAAKE